MEALGNHQNAIAYLEHAAKADPHGRWGTLAAAELGTTTHVS